ncbi:MAG: segregation/condensation protein A, partial [Atopostipes suicloacalis]|nr:segregation/condensation protein A [Atopostipes suicloacalis]
MEEKIEGEQQLKLQLDVFEGPLDLLLHLINQLEIDIYDIPIAKITSQYLKYLESMKKNQIELASEYFVLAASLMRIKSEMLVPRNENQIEMDEEYYGEDDPRKPLIDLLLEYKQIKEVIPKFEKQHEGRADFFGKEPADLSIYREKIEL